MRIDWSSCLSDNFFGFFSWITNLFPILKRCRKAYGFKDAVKWWKYPRKKPKWFFDEKNTRKQFEWTFVEIKLEWDSQIRTSDWELKNKLQIQTTITAFNKYVYPKKTKDTNKRYKNKRIKKYAYVKNGPNVYKNTSGNSEINCTKRWIWFSWSYSDCLLYNYWDFYCGRSNFFHNYLSRMGKIPSWNEKNGTKIRTKTRTKQGHSEYLC